MRHANLDNKLAWTDFHVKPWLRFQLFDKTDALIPDDKANTVLHSDDGGYLLVGTTGAGKIWLIKANALA